jgi:hypothetical protein
MPPPRQCPGLGLCKRGSKVCSKNSPLPCWLGPSLSPLPLQSPSGTRGCGGRRATTASNHSPEFPSLQLSPASVSFPLICPEEGQPSDPGVRLPWVSHVALVTALLGLGWEQAGCTPLWLGLCVLLGHLSWDCCKISPGVGTQPAGRPRDEHLVWVKAVGGQKGRMLQAQGPGEGGFYVPGTSKSTVPCSRRVASCPPPAQLSIWSRDQLGVDEVCAQPLGQPIQGHGAGHKACLSPGWAECPGNEVRGSTALWAFLPGDSPSQPISQPRLPI